MYRLMMHLTVSLSVCISVLLHQVSGQSWLVNTPYGVTGTEGCPTMNLAAPYANAQMDGTWFQVVRSANVAPRARVCSTLQFNLAANNIRETGHNLVSGALEMTDYATTITLPNPNEAIIKISLASNPNLFCDWRLGAINPGQWAALYCCQPNLYPHHYTGSKVMILSRSRDISLRASQQAILSLESAGVRFRPETVWHGDCQRYPGLPPEPAPNPAPTQPPGGQGGQGGQGPPPNPNPGGQGGQGGQGPPPNPNPG